jgi:VIT1/CCC1 family predicted Fe2+/Mn2+ transporter
MPASPERPSFRRIYREQYRKDSASTTTRVFQFITPAVLLVVAIFFRHSSVALIVFGVLAVLCFAVAIALSRRQRRNGAAPPGGEGLK